MFYTVYGTKSCPKCHATKRLFDAKGIEYEYVDLDNLNVSDKKCILDDAKAEGFMALPLIVDTNEKYYKLNEVLGC